MAIYQQLVVDTKADAKKIANENNNCDQKDELNR
jgi:hypothetical protein